MEPGVSNRWISAGSSDYEEVTRLRQRIRELEEEAKGRERIEASLRESRDLFQSFMNNSPLLAYMKDGSGRYVYANRVIETVLDRHTTEWWGKTDLDLWPEPTARMLRQNDELALQASETLRVAETLPQYDGDHHWITFKFTFTTNAGKRYLAGISLDVTDRARAEEERASLLVRERHARAEAEAALAAQQQSETRARRLFESNVIGIIEIENDHIVAANDFFVEKTGYTREDLQQQKLSWKALTPELQKGLDLRAVAELQSRGAFTPFEKELICRDGSFLPILIGGARLEPRRDQSRPLTYVCFVLDLSERKQLELRLLHSQKLESLGLLAGAIAHDFNNMLAAMMGNASLSLDALSASHPAYETLTEVVLAGRRASDLTQQLLAYSGRGRFVVKPIALTQLVGEVGKLVEAVMSKKIDLRMNLAQDIPCVDADSAQMQQVIMNLVINASEAIDENPGTVEVTTRTWDITGEELRRFFPDSGIPPGLHAYLEVRDTGCGMTDDTKARMFDPFFTTKVHGRGLGLAAVLGIVRTHRGAMRVESVLGVGTTVQVLFPVSREALALTSNGEARQTLAGKGLVMVVDDEEAVRRMAKATLERFGYTVVLAENGKEAVEMFAEMSDDVSAVLLDMAMPVMDGKEAARRMIEIRPRAPILITSGYNESEAIDWIEQQGLSGFIQKPYTATQLAEQIKVALEKP